MLLIIKLLLSTLCCLSFKTPHTCVFPAISYFNEEATNNDKSYKNVILMLLYFKLPAVSDSCYYFKTNIIVSSTFDTEIHAFLDITQ